MARVFERQYTWPNRLLLPLEKLIYRLTRVDPTTEMNWKEYQCSTASFPHYSPLTLVALSRLWRRVYRSFSLVGMAN
jgi:K+-transporting ATPase ATPase A chain